ncbi:ABC transporter ATP-binding protein [Halolamina sp. CBA1230]|uniref:ABC transporter ATP-binding protein n=1 Tax=Halolamina sp. CBA1230 TaxID=1853690 RepID=UPI0009A1C5AA|nr:ABC transporter ATP-binding protein [Halolamina sp. CBA1230]QKY20537.1 ABC transporter ATP-binding protein [Halolamina sp. CBA1230]
MPAITTTDLTKRYDAETAVHGLNLKIQDGEVYGFLGPNGAGKSTTISLLMDYVRPTEGSARILGLDPREDVVEIHQRVGILPDRFSVYDRLTGRRHLNYVIDSKNASDSPEDLLTRVGLGDAIDRQAGAYSNGMQQRLGLAMALVGEPDLLILDEPFTGLDPHGARTIRDLVYEENDRGATVFFSSHVLGQVELVCDRIGILNQGELIAEGRIDDLREQVDVESSIVFTLDQVPDGLADTLREQDGVVSVSAEDDELVVVTRSQNARWPVIQTIEQTSAPVDSFTMREPSIEDVFAAHTTGRTETADEPY